MTLIDKTEAVTLLHEIADDFADPHVRGAAIAVAHIFTERADALPARGVGVKKIRQIVEDESLEWAGLREGVLFQRVLDKIDAFLAALAPTDAVRCAECDCDDGNCTWIKMHIGPDNPTDAAQAREATFRDGWGFAYRQWQATGSVPDPDYKPSTEART